MEYIGGCKNIVRETAECYNPTQKISVKKNEDKKNKMKKKRRKEGKKEGKKELEKEKKMTSPSS